MVPRCSAAALVVAMVVCVLRDVWAVDTGSHNTGSLVDLSGGSDDAHAHRAYQGIVATLQKTYRLSDDGDREEETDTDTDAAAEEPSQEATGSAPKGYVPKRQLDDLQDKVKELEEENKRLAKSHNLQAASDSAERATKDAMRAESDKEQADAQVKRARHREALRVARMEQRSGPGIEMPPESEKYLTPGIRKAYSALKQSQAQVRQTEASYRKRTEELKRKVKSAKDAKSQTGSALEGQLEDMIALATQKTAEGKSKILKGKQRLARAEARKMADDTGQYDAVLRIYSQRTVEHRARIQGLKDELDTAKRESSFSDQDLAKARGKEQGVSAAERERREAQQSLTDIQRKLQTEEKKLTRDAARTRKYRALQEEKDKPAVGKNVQQPNAGQEEEKPRMRGAVDAVDVKSFDERMAELDRASGSGNQQFDFKNHDDDRIVRSMRQADRANEALSKSVDQNDAKSVRVLTKALEQKMFETSMDQWRLPGRFKAILQKSKRLVDEARATQISAARTRAIVAAVVAKREQPFPGWKAREMAATALGITTILNHTEANVQPSNGTNVTNSTSVFSSDHTTSGLENSTSSPVTTNRSNTSMAAEVLRISDAMSAEAKSLATSETARINADADAINNTTDNTTDTARLPVGATTAVPV